MKKSEAFTVSIGVLAVVDTYITATVFPIPVWVTFIAWASFFVVGGGPAGFVQSIASNLTGLVIASLSLLAIASSTQTPALVAAAALITGALFGIVSEALGDALTRKPEPQLN